MKLVKALIGCVILLLPAAISSADTCNLGSDQTPYAFASEKITISSTALPFTASVSQPPNADDAVMAVFTTETDAIRFLTDGTTPTSTIGHQVASGSSVTICGYANVRAFKAIRSGSVDAAIQVSYFRYN